MKKSNTRKLLLGVVEDLFGSLKTRRRFVSRRCEREATRQCILDKFSFSAKIKKI
jgi:hypothetical protein